MKKLRLTPSLLLTAALLASALLAATEAAAADTKMKDLMKKVGAATAGEDAKALAPLFEQAKVLAPADPEIDGMKALFDKGIAAANAGDLAGAKANCKECHTQFRDKYKAKHGSKAP